MTKIEELLDVMDKYRNLDPPGSGEPFPRDVVARYALDALPELRAVLELLRDGEHLGYIAVAGGRAMCVECLATAVEIAEIRHADDCIQAADAYREDDEGERIVELLRDYYEGGES